MEEIKGITIMNSESEEYHAHTITYSDGFNSVDEMVMHAGRIGMTRIVLTDHCQAYLNKFRYSSKTHRSLTRRWENIHNDVEVIFGIEADIINEHGDVSTDIQGIEAEHLILSAHNNVFDGDHRKITDAYLKAIERHGHRMMFLGHLCSVYFEEHIDVNPIIELALEKDVAFELNCANLVNKKTNMRNLEKMLSQAKKLYVNGDSHTLSELSRYRKEGFNFLRNIYQPGGKGNDRA